jgi:hypothetical protein
VARIRGLLGSFFVASLAASVLLVATMSGTASASHKQTPILECVFKDTGTGKWNTLWGYDNTSGSVENIPIGTGNEFSPGAQSQGQPTAFQPGQHDNVFVVTWSGSGTLTWTLNGQSASATTSSTKCSQNPVPIVPGTGNWNLALPVVLVALMTLGLGLYSWRFGTGLFVPPRRHQDSPTPQQ